MCFCKKKTKFLKWFSLAFFESEHTFVNFPLIKTRHWMEDPMKYAGIITLLIWILCTLYMFKAKIKTKHLIKVIFKLENTILYFSTAQMKYSFPKWGKKKTLQKLNYCVTTAIFFSVMIYFSTCAWLPVIFLCKSKCLIWKLIPL